MFNQNTSVQIHLQILILIAGAVIVSMLHLELRL